MEHLTNKDIQLPNRLGFHYFDFERIARKTESMATVLQEMKVGWPICVLQ